MKITDVLRKLADTIDQHGDNHTIPDEKIQNPAGMIAVEPVDDCGCDNAEEQPNSQEDIIGLIKHLSGVSNN